MDKSSEESYSDEEIRAEMIKRIDESTKFKQKQKKRKQPEEEINEMQPENEFNAGILFNIK